MAKILAVLALLVLLPYCSAVDHQVGDSPGWNTGVDYTTWASSNTFKVGDTLKFVYGSSHSVLEVSKADYDSCSTANAITTEATSPTTIQLTKTGPRYFICGAPGHCSQGMQLAVTVAAASGTPSTPSTTPSTTPATTSPSGSKSPGSTTPTTTSHSGAGALYVKGVVVVVAFCVALVVLL